MKKITTGDLRRMTDSEGLILQGCGGDLDEWVTGINDTLTQAGILLDGDTFKDVSVFEHPQVLCRGLTSKAYLRPSHRLQSIHS